MLVCCTALNVLAKRWPRRLCVMAATAFLLGPLPAHGQPWRDVYDPFTVLELSLEMDPGDWATVQNDTTFELERPAMFRAAGEEPILVAVRRKSSVSLDGKVSLKIDVNEYLIGQKWHDLTKLSLENGADAGVVAEGLAWYLHRQAAAAQNYGYTPGLAAWVNVTVNGDNVGVYANVEQVNKQFLQNRAIYVNGGAWLYKQGEIGPPELEVGETDSSTFLTLNYPPFGDLAPTPDAATLAQQLPALINMHGMLTVGAVNAFSTNPDELFNKGKNFFFADFLYYFAGGRRMYFPWDLDAVFRRTDASIYGQRGPGGSLQQHPYQQIILNHPLFRCQYNRIMLDLVDGPLSPAAVGPFLDQLEPVLAPYLAADPAEAENDSFASLAAWIANRNANVRAQLLADGVGLALAGDLDCSGSLDRRDVALFVRHFGRTSGSTWLTGDLDGDGATTLADWGLLVGSMGPSASSPAVGLGSSPVVADARSSAVPEPSAAVLGLFLVGLAAARLSWVSATSVALWR
jgi:hypothetical protein